MYLQRSLLRVLSEHERSRTTTISSVGVALVTLLDWLSRACARVFRMLSSSIPGALLGFRVTRRILSANFDFFSYK